MNKYIDTDKLIAEIERLIKEHEKALNKEDNTLIAEAMLKGSLNAYEYIKHFLSSPQQEQPDNEDIDKVAQELYEHLYELKRRNNVPTNLYDKQEIIDLWKAGIEYGRNHPRQEQPEENKLPSKRTRVNYAICKLQAFKPLRETIVLDGYVYDEGKCYRENLLNYINAIPESRLTEIRSYLKEKGWWPYGDDTDWMEKGQPEADWEKEINDYMEEHHLQMLDGGIRYDKRRNPTGN